MFFTIPLHDCALLQDSYEGFSGAGVDSFYSNVVFQRRFQSITLERVDIFNRQSSVWNETSTDSILLLARTYAVGS